MAALVVYIDAGEAALRSWNFDTDMLPGQTTHDHISLRALEEKDGLRVGMFTCDLVRPEDGFVSNTIATKIVRYLRTGPGRRHTDRITGPVILYNDDGDFTADMWKLVQQRVRQSKAGECEHFGEDACRSAEESDRLLAAALRGIGTSIK